ncbi:flagellar hook-basal body complex protein FliE [Maritimibacter alkaliphilus]|uniref:flagellar hook-basal body complex protein FliE n=1 Tax=Maritimibacter alkaliphilus TaxID=404236 RepID=UPI001C965307|nr:flagellar hook-basal body complex protein FliE [Maritimibacter alkaliphilus]MBY6090642.1 flagellar hook-basal body complex protein FliE [Maritimibacter alkaliphilus]
MDIRALTAAQKYQAARPATEPIPGGRTAGDALRDLGRDFATTLQEGEDMARAAMTGSVDPHALVQALSQAELAVETVVTVRDKVVEAYQEILRMPV